MEICENQLPEAAAHMYPSDLEKFKSKETFSHAYSVAVGCPDERSVPLFRLSDMVEFAEKQAALKDLEIFGLNSSIGHLGALVDEQRTLLAEVERRMGSDDWGIPLEDGESKLLDSIREHLATVAAPTQQEA